MVDQDVDHLLKVVNLKVDKEMLDTLTGCAFYTAPNRGGTAPSYVLVSKPDRRKARKNAGVLYAYMVFESPEHAETLLSIIGALQAAPLSPPPDLTPEVFQSILETRPILLVSAEVAILEIYAKLRAATLDRLMKVLTEKKSAIDKNEELDRRVSEMNLKVHGLQDEIASGNAEVEKLEGEAPMLTKKLEEARVVMGGHRSALEKVWMEKEELELQKRVSALDLGKAPIVDGDMDATDFADLQ